MTASQHTAGWPSIQMLGRVARPGHHRDRASALAAALLLARTQEAALWHEADPSHRAGILGSLSHTYQVIADSCDPAAAADLAEGMTGTHPYAELAQLARILSDSERRLALGGPDALPVTWHQLPRYTEQLDGAEKDAWTRYWLSTSRAERSGLLRATLSAAVSSRAGNQAAAFLAAVAWSEHAITGQQVTCDTESPS